MKQQIKCTWVGQKPGLMGCEFTRLDKDPEEKHYKMVLYLWATSPQVDMYQGAKEIAW